MNLSLLRAENVKQAIVAYAKEQNFNLNLDQLQPVGVGIAEPVIAVPRNEQQAAQNRRVEFRIVAVDPESTTESDFDF